LCGRDKRFNNQDIISIESTDDILFLKNSSLPSYFWFIHGEYKRFKKQTVSPKIDIYNSLDYVTIMDCFKQMLVQYEWSIFPWFGYYCDYRDFKLFGFLSSDISTVSEYVNCCNNDYDIRCGPKKKDMLISRYQENSNGQYRLNSLIFSERKIGKSLWDKFSDEYTRPLVCMMDLKIAKDIQATGIIRSKTNAITKARYDTVYSLDDCQTLCKVYRPHDMNSFISICNYWYEDSESEDSMLIEPFAVPFGTSEEQIRNILNVYLEYESYEEDYFSYYSNQLIENTDWLFSNHARGNDKDICWLLSKDSQMVQDYSLENDVKVFSLF